MSRLTKRTHVIHAFDEGRLLPILEINRVTNKHVTARTRSTPHISIHPDSNIQANNSLIRTVHQQNKNKNKMKSSKTEPTSRYNHMDTKITKIGVKTTKYEFNMIF